MFIIMRGRLRVTMRLAHDDDTEEREIATLSQGAVVGEMSLLLRKPRGASVYVKSASATVAEIRYAKSAMCHPKKALYYPKKRPGDTRHAQ